MFPSPSNSLSYISYLVKPGDTFASIANQYGVTVQQVIGANPGQLQPVPGFPVSVPTAAFGSAGGAQGSNLSGGLNTTLGSSFMSAMQKVGGILGKTPIPFTSQPVATSSVRPPADASYGATGTSATTSATTGTTSGQQPPADVQYNAPTTSLPTAPQYRYAVQNQLYYDDLFARQNGLPPPLLSFAEVNEKGFTPTELISNGYHWTSAGWQLASQGQQTGINWDDDIYTEEERAQDEAAKRRRQAEKDAEGRRRAGFRETRMGISSTPSGLGNFAEQTGNWSIGT